MQKTRSDTTKLKTFDLRKEANTPHFPYCTLFAPQILHTLWFSFLLGFTAVTREIGGHIRCIMGNVEVATVHFTGVSLVSKPLSERETVVDLVLIQTSFLFL